MQLVNLKINLDLIAPVKVSPPLSSRLQKSPLPLSVLLNPSTFLIDKQLIPPPPPTLFALKGLSNMNLLT